MNRTSANPRLVWARAAVLAGLAGAVVEMVFVLPIQAMLGASPERVMQSIAVAVLGRDAFLRGTTATLIGIASHTAVSLVAAGIYVAAALWWDDVLVRKPVICGVVLGAISYLVMTFGVVPLSLIGFVPAKSLPLLWASLGVHLFAFGLPIALVARAVLGRSSPVRP